jgi:hypothetical protein
MSNDQCINRDGVLVLTPQNEGYVVVLLKKFRIDKYNFIYDMCHEVIGRVEIDGKKIIYFSYDVDE